MKRNYQVPSVKVVSFKVEDIFTSVGDTQDYGVEDLQVQQNWYESE